MSKLQLGSSLILKAENDKLGYLDKVKIIKKFIETNYCEWGVFSNSTDDRMIALYGGRWSWKSSIMTTLCHSDDENYVLKNDFKTLFFEARKYEKDNNLPLSLFHFIGRNLSENEDERQVKLSTQNKIYAWIRWALWWLSFSVWGELSPISINFSGKDALNTEKEKLNELLKQQQNDLMKIDSLFTDIENLTKWFTDLIDNISKWQKIVVFIDDLDRCETENVINILSTIKLFFTYAKNIVFVVWVDKEAVVKWLKNKYDNDIEKAEEYLEKIFTMSFSVYKKPIIKELIGLYRTDERIVEAISDMFFAIGFTTPRHIKKILNKYWIMRNEILKYIPNLEEDTNLLIIFLYLVILYEFNSDYFYDLGKNNKEFSRNEYIELYKVSGNGKKEPLKSNFISELMLFSKFIPELFDYKKFDENGEMSVSGIIGQDVNVQVQSKLVRQSKLIRIILPVFWKNKDFVKYLSDKLLVSSPLVDTPHYFKKLKEYSKKLPVLLHTIEILF